MFSFTTTQEREFNVQPTHLIWLVDVYTSVSSFRTMTDSDVPLRGSFAGGRPTPTILSMAPFATKLDLNSRITTIGSHWLRLNDDGVWRDIISSLRGKGLRLRFRYGTPNMSESDFVISHWALVDDWKYDNGQWDVQLKEARQYSLQGRSHAQRSYYGHPLDVMLNLLQASFLNISSLVDTTAYDPVTAMPNQAHWVVGRNRGKFSAYGIEWQNGHMDSATDYDTLFKEVAQLLPGVTYFDSQGRYSYRFIDLTASQVTILTETDCEFEQLSAADPITNLAVVNGNKANGGYMSSIVATDSASTAISGEHRFEVSSDWINGHNDSTGPTGTSLASTDGAGTTFRIRYSTTTNQLADFLRMPISGTYNASTTIPTARQINGTRTVFLQFVDRNDRSISEIIECDAMTVDPTNSVYLEFTVLNRGAVTYGWDTSGLGFGGRPADIYDVTIGEYLTNFWIDMQSNGASRFRINTHMGLANLEIGDLVGINTRQYTHISRRDGSNTGDNFLVTSKDIDKYAGKVIYEIISVTNPTSTTTTTTPSPTPGPVINEPYFVSSGAIVTDASGSAYYPSGS